MLGHKTYRGAFEVRLSLKKTQCIFAPSIFSSPKCRRPTLCLKFSLDRRRSFEFPSAFWLHCSVYIFEARQLLQLSVAIGLPVLPACILSSSISSSRATGAHSSRFWAATTRICVNVSFDVSICISVVCFAPIWPVSFARSVVTVPSDRVFTS